MRAAFILAFGVAAAVSVSAEQSWTGQISDSMCRAKHEEAAEGAGKMADHDCTVSCVRGGSKYVLMVDGKVYQIANQSFADLERYAGAKVNVSGDLKADTITVTRIEPAKD